LIRLAQRQRQCDAQHPGQCRPQQDVADRHAQREQPRREQRPDDRACVVKRTVQPKREAALRGRHGVREQRIARRGAQSFAEPVQYA
jgi:hypothetical protein